MPVDQPQRDLWLVTAGLLSPDRHGEALQSAAQSRPDIVFDLRDFTGYSRNEASPGPTPSLAQIEFLIRLAGSLYPPAGYPSFSWGGDHNGWDAADYGSQSALRPVCERHTGGDRRAVASGV